MNIKIHSFTVGPFYENTYLLEKEGRALLIDPGFSEEREFDSFQQKLESENLELKAIVLTHAHVDHVLGIKKVLHHYDIPVFLSDEDHYLWQNFSNQASIFGFEAEAFDFNPEPLPQEKGWEVATFTFDTFYTPGHSPDHVVLYNEANKFLIAGDTLFKQGIGRTDLYKGNLKQLEKSIKENLYTLPNGTTVYPGHGPETTIGYEKESNPFIRGE